MRFVLFWAMVMHFWSCRMWIDRSLPYYCNGKSENNPEVHCFGTSLLEIPGDLPKLLSKLVITDADIQKIRKNSLDPYRGTLRDVTLSNLPKLRVIEDGTFANINNLRTLYISHAPQLKFLNGLLKGVTSSKFYSLRIVFTGLVEVPELFHLPGSNTMFLLDLDHNKIERIRSNSIKIAAEQVTINFNPHLVSVEDYAFNGSQIAILSMHSNHGLYELGEHAFKGLSSLRFLDLSQTAIQNLPIAGLEELETLKIEETPTMHTIPSIYDLTNLREARLTHSFHCCAFRYPAQHNPEKHAQYEEKVKKICEELQKSRADDTVKKKRDVNLNHSRYIITDGIRGNLTNMSIEDLQASITGHNPLIGKTLYRQEGKHIDVFNEDEEFFHSQPTDVHENHSDIYCGKIISQIQEVECFPKPNALNPCEDIMGASWLRISVWCVLILALVGNTAVIAVVVFSDSDINVSRFLICNLSFADFCTGLYLLLIASMDYHTVGEYFNFAFEWQYGLGCQIAGFLTVFSNHLSIFTLTIVTLERWFAITYAIHLTKRITIKSAMYILLIGWFYSILIAGLPVFGVSNYSSTSICLPMEANKLVDKAYLYWLIFINGAAFALIVFCYVQIYLSLGYETRRASTKGEMTIAKKMALLIFIDFATVAPVAFFGLTALAGYPLIGVPRSKILLVFFYPLNACANPYLYALMTAQYRKDLYILVSRCGFCKKNAERYKLSDAMPLSNPGLLNRHHSYSNGECVTAKTYPYQTNTFV